MGHAYDTTSYTAVCAWISEGRHTQPIGTPCARTIDSPAITTSLHTAVCTDTLERRFVHTQLHRLHYAHGLWIIWCDFACTLSKQFRCFRGRVEDRRRCSYPVRAAESLCVGVDQTPDAPRIGLGRRKTMGGLKTSRGGRNRGTDTGMIARRNRESVRKRQVYPIDQQQQVNRRSYWG